MTSESITETNSDDRSRWLALYVLCAGVLMIVLDATVVNVALPTIQDDLDFTNANLAWVVNAYLIAFGGSLLLAGRLGDLIGKRAIFLSGMAIFTGLSLICGLAPTQEVLIGARFFQGVGGAMTAAVALGMIVTMFPEPREQAKAIGVYAFVASAGGSVGLLAGGVLTQALSWHWIFFVNIPIGIATAVMAIRLVHKDKGIGLAGGADLPGAVLIVSSLMLGVYTIVSPAEQKGWGDSLTLGLGALTLLLLAAFIWREATARNPLVPLRIFRSRNVSGANIVQALSVVGMFGVFFMGALYLQGARLRRTRDRPRLPAHDDLHGHAVDPLFGAADHSLRWPAGHDRRTGRDGHRTGDLHHRPGRRRLLPPRVPRDGLPGPRGRHGLPGPGRSGDVGGDPAGRRTRVRAGQHLGPGRRSDRPGPAGDILGLTDREPDRRRHFDARGIERRLPPRVLDWGGHDSRGDRRRGAGPRTGCGAFG